MKGLAHISAFFVFLTIASGFVCHAQKSKREVGAQAVWGVGPSDQENALRYIVEGKDTIFIDHLKPSKVYSRLPRQKGREWRKYYRLVHNFSKAYPYALVARRLVQEADSTIAADNLTRVKRDKYITSVQNELFSVSAEGSPVRPHPRGATWSSGRFHKRVSRGLRPSVKEPPPCPRPRTCARVRRVP